MEGLGQRPMRVRGMPGQRPMSIGGMDLFLSVFVGHGMTWIGTINLFPNARKLSYTPYLPVIPHSYLFAAFHSFAYDFTASYDGRLLPSRRIMPQAMRSSL